VIDQTINTSLESGVIDHRAIIHPTATIAANVQIGPWTIIGPDVEIGEGTWVGPHVVIQGPTKIGRDNKIYQFASIGEVPQDKKFQGEKTYLEIGDRNIVREFCTLNRGTAQDHSITRIGSDNLFMAYVHIAHDCVIGNHTIFANNASLAGHVQVGDYAILGGFSGVLQSCRVGAHSFASMGSMIAKDIPPFVKVSGYYAKPFGLNSVGIKRRGFTKETVSYLRRAYRIIYREGLTVVQALEQLKPLVRECPAVQDLVSFMETTVAGIVR
jgi:UDP-N-acetylglucosamine acyltransferase